MRKLRSSLCGLLVCACGGADPERPADVADAPNPAAAAGPVEAPWIESPARTFPATAIDRREAPVFGHLLLPRPAAWLAELGEQVLPPRMSGLATPAGLLGFVVLSTGLPPALAEHADLERPFGCVVGELSPAPRVACSLGYRGGALQFTTDVGARQAGASGHVAEFEVGGYPVFIDAIGGDVVLSVETGFFAEVDEYIESALVGRADAVRSDLEFVVFSEHLYARHGDTLLALADVPEDKLATGLLNATSESERRLWEMRIEAERRNDRAAMQKFGEYVQVTGFVDLDRGRLSLGAQLIPRVGGRFPADSLTRGRSLDPELLAGLPREVVALVAYDIDPWATVGINRYTSGPITEDDVRNAIASLAALWAAVNDSSASAAEVALNRHFLEDRALYGGSAAWAMLDHPGTPLTVVGIRRLAPGQSGRASWLAWTENMQSGVLRSDLAKSFAWSFVPGAWSLDGAEVDRWTIRAVHARALAEIAAIDPALASIAREGVAIDRVERDGYAYFVVAPGAEEAVLRRVFAARGGEHRLGDEPRFKSLRARDPEAFMLFGFDLARLRGALAAQPNLVRALDMQKLVEADIGEALDDFLMSCGETEQGLARGELVMGPGLLRALRAL
ncbi:hypothetical protein OV203_40280 [Nannocystis sp. ILAH1]|uniref:hypothetical protein n=1 Tax=Nannocystis sp. ILAH1 TaxID=2996789 RepID=UPI00227069D5|nr:hypothetical protein [Nannocystis sp. ILAH1]MCY0993445.1 hypothetical protein [Nannocystis sp. ILAH1]